MDNQKEGFQKIIIILCFWKILVYFVTFGDQIRTRGLLLLNPLKIAVQLNFSPPDIQHFLALFTCVFVLCFIYLAISSLSNNPNNVKLVHTAFPPVTFCLSSFSITRTTNSKKGKSKKENKQKSCSKNLSVFFFSCITQLVESCFPTWDQTHDLQQKLRVLTTPRNSLSVYKEQNNSFMMISLIPGSFISLFIKKAGIK